LYSFIKELAVPEIENLGKPIHLWPHHAKKFKMS